MHLDVGPNFWTPHKSAVLPPEFERRALISAFGKLFVGDDEAINHFIDTHDISSERKTPFNDSSFWKLAHNTWGSLKAYIIDVEDHFPNPNEHILMHQRVGMLFCLTGEVGVFRDEPPLHSPSIILQAQQGYTTLSCDSHFSLQGKGTALLVYVERGKDSTCRVEYVWPQMRLPTL